MAGGKRGNPKTECPVCGSRMEQGGRVRVTLSWEALRTFDYANGERHEWVGLKSKSGFVCRRCGYRLAAEAGIPRPEGVA